MSLLGKKRFVKLFGLYCTIFVHCTFGHFIYKSEVDIEKDYLFSEIIQIHIAITKV